MAQSTVVPKSCISMICRFVFPTDMGTTAADPKIEHRPVVALFHTTKGCACTLKRCKTSIVLMDDYMESLAADLAYVKVDIGINRQQGKNYKIFGAPTVVFFDSAGNEVKRLNSWEIKVEIIDPILSEISKSANEPKTEK